MAHGILPDGDYRATLPAGSIADEAGNPSTGHMSFDFFVLAGDANHDRAVDTLDFNSLAANFGKTGRDFSQANFNYDAVGVVDTLDFNILATQFGKSLPPASSLVATAAISPPHAATPFGAIRIGDGADRSNIDLIA